MVEESSELPKLTPLQQILFDLETDKIIEDLPTDVQQTEVETQQVKKELDAVFKHLRAKRATSNENLGVSPASVIKLSKLVYIEPIATLAAAETVIATVRWEGGDVRLLQSTMRSDLAIEVLVDQEFVEVYEDSLILISLGRSEQTIAIFPGESAVFCGSPAQDLSDGKYLYYNVLDKNEVNEEHHKILQESKENLLSPKSLKFYRELIKQVESQS